MSLEKIINTLGHYAKDAWDTVKRSVNTVLALAALTTIISMGEAQGQSRKVQGDTLWGTGYFLTRDMITNEIIPNANLYLTPAEMQMVVPDITYEYQTGLTSTHFNLPVYIDSTVGIPERRNSKLLVFPSFCSDINILFENTEYGIISFYDMSGNIVLEKDISGSNTYLQLHNLETGMYIYHIKTESGLKISGKFMKQNLPPNGSALFTSNNLNEKNGSTENNRVLFENYLSSETALQSTKHGKSDYEADYWAKWEHQDYYTDSTLITIHDGLNSSAISFNMKLLIETVYRQAYFGLKDTTGGGSTNVDSDLYIWPDSVEMITLDTVYTEESGSFITLPIYIDTIPDDTIYGEHFAANYWVKWTPPMDTTLWGTGHYTDSCLVTITDTTEFVILYATPVPQLTPNLDLEGFVWKLENTSQTLANAQVRVTVNSTGDEYTATSNSNGYFMVEGLPLGEEITFDVGGITGRYSFAGTNFTTPVSIDNPADSVNSNFSAVLPLKLASSSAQHIRDQTSNGTRQDTIWFYLGNSLNNTQKNTMRNWFTNLQSDEGNVYIFAESLTQLNNTGINIEFGTYNTQTYNEGINTPIGGTLYPVIYANTTMGTSAGYVPFVHEIKRALGFDGVGWYSVMRADAPDYTQEDKDIAEFVERPYWNALYHEEKTWIDLNKIVEDMPGR